MPKIIEELSDIPKAPAKIKQTGLCRYDDPSTCPAPTTDSKIKSGNKTTIKKICKTCGALQDVVEAVLY